jgi:hypothetical protein
MPRAQPDPPRAARATGFRRSLAPALLSVAAEVERMRKATVALGMLALGVVTEEARGDDGRWVMGADGSWTQVEPPSPASTAAPAPAPWSPAPEAAAGWPGRAPAVEAAADDERRAEEPRGEEWHPEEVERPIRSGWGVAGGIVLTSIGGTLLLGAALASLPIGYEGSGGGDPGAAEATVAILGAAATAGGIGLIVWGGTRPAEPRTVLSVGRDVRLSGSF